MKKGTCPLFHLSPFYPSLKMQDENIALHRFALFTACCTAFLIFVGGLLTNTQSGLSVPDWPTTYGWSRIGRSYSDDPLLFRPALTILVLAVVEISLGAATVWTAKAVLPTTAHVLTGALVLGTSFLLKLRAYAMVVDRVPAWK